MYRIALIDDKTYAIAQLFDALAPWTGLYSFHYFPSYRPAVGIHFDCVLLDYYLDIDGIVGRDVVRLLDAETIVGFSSDIRCGEEIVAAGGLVAIEKLEKGTLRNEPLREFFGRFFREGK